MPLDSSRFLFVRWLSRTDHHDQVWVGSLDGRTSRPLAFNQPDSDSSDPFPIDNNGLVLFASTRRGGQGGYDLYLGDAAEGTTWSMSALGINSPQDELGVTYHQGTTKP